MARSRRRSAPRVRKDWVYNSQAYSNLETTITIGPANGVAFPLTISQTARRIQKWGLHNVAPSLTEYDSWSAIPEGGGQRVYAADCTVFVRPSVWAVGNDLRLGWRLLIARQDPTDGTMLQDPNYGLWQGVLNPGTQPSQWANQGFLREGYAYHSFGDNNIGWTIRPRWFSRRGRSMAPSEALFLYLENSNNPSGGVNSIVIPRCRALQNVDSGV
jgi:hypothetical protein